jgi:hypothetical protein
MSSRKQLWTSIAAAALLSTGVLASAGSIYVNTVTGEQFGADKQPSDMTIYSVGSRLVGARSSEFGFANYQVEATRQ